MESKLLLESDSSNKLNPLSQMATNIKRNQMLKKSKCVDNLSKLVFVAKACLAPLHTKSKS